MGSQGVLVAQGLAIEEVTRQVVESKLKFRRDSQKLWTGSWSGVEIRKYSMGHYIYPPVGYGLMIIPRVGYCGEAHFLHYSPDNSRHGWR